MLTWNPPPVPNGVIIAYEITYRSGSEGLTTVNTTDVSIVFATPELLPGTNVSGISVRAYTSIGPGEAAMHPSVVTPQEPVPRELLVSQTTEYKIAL